MDSNLNINEINVFLGDISHHLKNNLQSFDYQNTFKNSTELSNEELESRKLLERCEKIINLLKYLTNGNHCCNCNCNKNKIKENNVEENQNFNGTNNLLTRNSIILENDDDSSYLDMSANKRIKDNEYMDYTGPSSFSTISNINSDLSAPLSIPITNFNTTFHSTRSQKKHRTTTSMIECLDSDSDKDLYDICNISSDQSNDRQITSRRQTTSFPLNNNNNNHHQRSKSMEENEPILDCPYIGLPAAHLQIHKSPKLGQLIRIEKRLFFDQTKKYYCGILNDWLLCYNTDGTTINNTNSNNNNNNNINNINSNTSSSQMRPIVCIQLSGTEIEHYGEGKRRDLCFQIINSETNKKFIFQSLNEIDTKEWIHAIEASIRGDFYIEKICQPNKLIIQNCNNNTDSRSNSNSPKSSIHISFNNSLRKLPTPPIQNKCNLMTLNESICNQQCEDIYEEPSTLYQINNHDIIKENNEFSVDSLIIQSDEMPPDIPIKLGKLKINTTSNDIIEYDVPKCINNQYNNSNQTTSDKNESVNSTLLPVTIASTSKSLENSELLDNSKMKTEFQIKIKDVHNKLTNQFTKAAAAASNGQNNDDKLKKVKKSITTNNDSKSLVSSTSKQNGIKKTIIKSPNKTTNNQKSISPINTPVKNWFLNRLNKTASINLNSNGMKISPVKSNNTDKDKKHNNIPESENLLEINNDNDITDFNNVENINKNINDNSKFINDIPSQKGGKVNRIINQLEANGHLPIFSQQNYDRFNAALLLGGTNLFSNDNDDCNYEPIMASNK